MWLLDRLKEIAKYFVISFGFVRSSSITAHLRMGICMGVCDEDAPKRQWNQNLQLEMGECY